MTDTRIDEADDAPVVTIAQGQVRGVQRPGSVAYLGIPFAQAPVDELRFAAPQPHQGWDGVLDCTQYGPTPQRRAFAEVTSIPEPSIPGDQTLNVNVFTPAADRTDARLPVYVWIHGGGYKAGSPASPWYDGRAFNRDGVVTVTVSYRLGFDGFGWIDGQPDNRGLLDQILALQWVQQNIAAFGGDPGRVTIGGQSAGGGSVLAMLASPLAEGLFHRAISHSGALELPSRDAMVARTRRLAELCGVEASAEGFRTLTEVQILDATEALEREIGGPAASADELVSTMLRGEAMGLAFLPWLDGEAMAGPLLEQLGRPAARGIPLVLGSTADEFSGAAVAFAPLAADGAVPSVLRQHLGDAAEDFEAEYADVAGGDERYLGALMTDVMFRMPLVRFANSRDTEATWAYDWRFRPPGIGMAMHCADLPAAWDCYDAEHVDASLGDNPPRELADAMHGAWVRFIQTGAAPWRHWDDTQPTLVFDAGVDPANLAEAVRPDYLVEARLTRLSDQADASVDPSKEA